MFDGPRHTNELTVRMIEVPILGMRASSIGFGGSSLGSRVGQGGGLKALHKAFELGITWYDVAPSYGDGCAEIILGQFLCGKRHQVQIVTKVGFVSRPQGSLLRLAASVARELSARVPAVRGILRQIRPQPSQRLPLNRQTIWKSVTESLHRLRTDFIDVLALHEPDLTDVRNAEIRAAVEDLVREGLVRAAAVAGSAEVIEAAHDYGFQSRIFQCEHNPFSRTLDRLRARGIVTASVTPVTYGVFGIGGTCARLDRALRMSPSLRGEVHQLGYEDSRTATTSLALDYAFATNPSGVVLLSMLQPGHLAMNVSRAVTPPNARVIKVVDRLVSVLDLNTRERGYQS